MNTIPMFDKKVLNKEIVHIKKIKHLEQKLKKDKNNKKLKDLLKKAQNKFEKTKNKKHDKKHGKKKQE